MTNVRWMLAALVGISLASTLLVGGGGRGETAFPGADGMIAFESERDGDGEIYSMNADGSGQTNLTRSDAWDGHPAWSPDGTRIAFTTFRDGNYEIYSMNADGTGQTRLTIAPDVDAAPGWSPDGKRIVFMSNRDDSDCDDWWDGDCNFDIYTMNADGSDPIRLTTNFVNDGFPVWSPDGETIAFHSSRDGNFNVYAMNADGSGQVGLTNDPAFEAKPDWSPDGEKIVFDAGTDGDFDIYTMNADGSGVAKLTNNQPDDGFPAWSPDGSTIAFASERDGNFEIYAMDTDGQNQTRLTAIAGPDDVPDWQPIMIEPTPSGQQVTWGDDDCDGDADAVDALKNLQHIAAIPFQQNDPCFPLGDPVSVTQIAGFGEILWGDVDCDGDVDAVDALQILRFVAGLQPNQQAGCPPIGSEVLVQ